MYTYEQFRGSRLPPSSQLKIETEDDTGSFGVVHVGEPASYFMHNTRDQA